MSPDFDNDGKIDIKDLTRALEKRGHKSSQLNAKVQYWKTNCLESNLNLTFHCIPFQQFIQKSDQNQSGNVDFTEFIEYCMEHEKRLEVLFRDIDVNKDGRLDTAEIIDAFQHLGVTIDSEEANKLIKKIKNDGTVSISFEEWRDYLILHPATEITELMTYWKHSVSDYNCKRWRYQCDSTL